MLDELIDAGRSGDRRTRSEGSGGEQRGAAAQLQQGIIFTLRDGATVRVEIYSDPEKARAVAGLRE